MARKSRSSRSAAPVSAAVDPLVQEPLFGITTDVFVPGVSDATDSILAFLAEPGDAEPTFTNAPKVRSGRNGSKAARRKARKTAHKPKASRLVVARSEVTATLQEVADDSTPAPKERKAAKSSRKRTTARKSPKGSVTVESLPKGEQVPEGMLCRIRWHVLYEDAAGTTFHHFKPFRFYRKAEAAADKLVNRGLAVTLRPERVLFARKPKAA